MTRTRLLLLTLAISLGAGAYAFVGYRAYADVWLRKPPKLPTCALIARRDLRKPVNVSGIEPHTDAEGNTVYLTEVEDKAVRCLAAYSRDNARMFTSALAETEPERRALELMKLVRDKIRREPSDDRSVFLTYMLADAAMSALPMLPEVRAASAELDQVHACRFDSRMKCHTRPPIPLKVWLTGVPASLGLLFVVGSLGRLGISAIARRVRRRKAKPESPKAETPPDAPIDEPRPEMS